MDLKLRKAFYMECMDLRYVEFPAIDQYQDIYQVLLIVMHIRRLQFIAQYTQK